MKRFVADGARRGARRRVARRLPRNPYTAAAAFAADNPRAAFLTFGGVAVVGGMALLIMASSVQAFLVISQQSDSNNQGRLSLVTDLVTDPENLTEEELAAALVQAADADPLAPTVAATPIGQTPTQPVTADEVVSVYGIRVHRSIADNVRALIDAAAADGIVLSGWGWRDNATQIRLRREHCGRSEYAIYQMPSSQCSPPTARPGRSQHERGLAVDFTYNGGSIGTQRSPGFIWLNANAAAYGLKNLASEPWHWSTTGR
jgi:LAS superfamily LD-carboxypeptidase LdcB